jgi:protein-tyrosine phosphatase
MTILQTSLSSPLHVSWITGLDQGQLGITLAPGKHSTSTDGTLWRRDLGSDLTALAASGVTDLVCLLTDKDLAKLTISRLPEMASALGLQVHRLPIVNRGVPADRWQLIELLVTLRARLAAGGSVVIHCEGGKGRAGVVAGCLLVALGDPAPEALRRLQEARGEGCPENARQRAFIERFATECRPWGASTLDGPRTEGPLTIFPLHGADASLPAILPLGEALERGVALVREGDNFSQLVLDNHGDRPVLCLAGDLVRGGMQDRVLSRDTLLAPRQTGLVVEAFCVEAGRWEERAGEASDRFASDLLMAPAQLRRQLIVGVSQGEVWQEVARTQERLGRSRGRALQDERSASSLALSLSLPELQEAMATQLAFFEASTAEPTIKGYLAHIEGVGWQLEWFATGALFQSVKRRLLKALVTEALGASMGPRAASLVMARSWLASASLLHTSPKAPAGVATRHQRARGGISMSLTRWLDRQVIHGVAVGS